MDTKNIAVTNIKDKHVHVSTVQTEDKLQIQSWYT